MPSTSGARNRRLPLFWTLVLSVGLFCILVVWETVKMSCGPRLSEWQSHGLTMLFCTLISGPMAFYALGWRQRQFLAYRALEMQLAQARKMETIGQLAAGIAHEINTPIQYIGDNIAFLGDAFADLRRMLDGHERLLARAHDDTLDDKARAEAKEAVASPDLKYLSSEIPKAIAQTLEGVGRVAKIVKAMKEFSHPGSEMKAPADLNKLIETTVSVTQNEWKYVAEVATDFDANLPLVPCIAGEFNQAILNMIVNAVHAIGEKTEVDSSQKGVIQIRTRAFPDCVEIRIGDTGTGIPESARAKIFEPFFTTKPVGKGTGQGLAIAHSVIVNKHGGTLTFETETGRGTVFIVRLPIAQTGKVKARESGKCREKALASIG